MNNPVEDGLTHINVYSRGRTELGRLLSNFAHTPFSIPECGPFASVEGWWYWRNCRDDRLRLLSGLPAKILGRELCPIPKAPPSREELKVIYLYKIEANRKVLRLLIESSLPFTHYYVNAGRYNQTFWRWTGELWNEVRETAKRAHDGGLGAMQQPESRAR